MARLLCCLLSLILLSGPAQAEPPEKAELLELIKALAVVNDIGATCGDQLNYYGKRALTGRDCIDFKKAFEEHWGSRKQLLDLVNNYHERYKAGEFNFENCDVTLQRIEELRIFATYYLDYMDFQAEL